MSFQFCRRKFYFLLALALPGYAAVHPVQHSAREQVNAQVLNAASQKIESLAQQRQWHDYRYTFKIYIPSQIATAAPCTKTPGVTLTSPAEIALNRMNFTVSCPQSWQMNVAVRPDVLVPVVMTKSLVARDTPLTANDVELKPEGQALKTLIEQRLDGVTAEVAKVRAHMPEILQWQRERLVSKLEDAEVQLENNRLEQELVLMAQRIDVAEELDRLEAHVKETWNILKKKEAVGRRLDFMMQEFNRESNTLASKSINAEVTNSAIELKVLIEQMREQIQNIE